ncbi:hypothetical protein WDU94_010233 [Cyamophila willieti]
MTTQTLPKKSPTSSLLTKPVVLNKATKLMNFVQNVKTKSNKLFGSNKVAKTIRVERDRSMVIKSVRLNTDEDEYKKDLQLKREDIRLLQEWLRSQPQYPPITDVLLIRHLQVCDYSIERTKQIIDTHLQLRTAIPEVFTNTNPFLPEVQTVFRHTNMFMIPEHTKDGYRILYAGLHTTDSSSYVLEEVMKTFAMVAEAIDGEQGSCPGYIICIDSEKVCFGHLTKINFSIVRRLFHFAYIVTDILPFYLENHKTVNVKEGGSVDEVKFHSKMDDFYKVMPREIFPKDMAGDAPYTKEELSRK